jgi:cytochrome c2
MRRLTTGIMAGLLLLSAPPAQAFDETGGNALWGKYAIQTCRSCHKAKGLSSLMPGEKSEAEWSALFADRYKKLRDMKHDFSAMGINDRQLENIHRYLVEESGTSEDVGAATQAAAPKTIEPRAKKVSSPGENDKGEGVKEFDFAAGDSIKGRYVFRRCLTCHKKNNATIISPADRTMAAWDRFFTGDYKKFKKAMPQFDTYGYTVEQMEHLHRFVLQYALDGLRPKTCE